jgi:hypothetical protein
MEHVCTLALSGICYQRKWYILVSRMGTANCISKMAAVYANYHSEYAERSIKQILSSFETLAKYQLPPKEILHSLAKDQCSIIHSLGASKFVPKTSLKGQIKDKISTSTSCNNPQPEIFHIKLQVTSE